MNEGIRDEMALMIDICSLKEFISDSDKAYYIIVIMEKGK